MVVLVGVSGKVVLVEASGKVASVALLSAIRGQQLLLTTIRNTFTLTPVVASGAAHTYPKGYF